MAFRELQAMQAAYELLSPLDPSARQRTMAWLSAALADTTNAPTAGHQAATPIAQTPAGTQPADSFAQVVAEHTATAAETPNAAPAAPTVEPVAAAASEVAAEPEARPAPDPRPTRRRSAKATGRRAAKAVTSAPAATPAPQTPGRQGSRPTGEQFLADLAAAGTFKALAQTYGKSIGTIGNWANQLRERGYDIPVGRQKNA